MRINCPKCSKLFNVKDDQIPESGRLLQCGSCNYKWFFKPEIKIEQEEPTVIEQKIKTKEKHEKKIEKKEIIIDDESQNKNDIKENTTSAKIKENKNKINYFKILLVSLITFIAIIIILDTFKNKISIFLPQINIFLESLYETLKDIYFFLIDLFK